jgi:hypothetical protein
MLSKGAIPGTNVRIRAMWADVYFFKNRLAAKSADSRRGSCGPYQSATWRRGEQSAICINPRKKRGKILVSAQYTCFFEQGAEARRRLEEPAYLALMRTATWRAREIP